MRMHTCVRLGIAKLFLGAVLASCGLTLAGCDDADASGLALSLKPFYTDADLDSDAALPGTWTDAEDGLTFTFAAAEARAYTLTVKETDGDHVSSSEFEAHLVHLGGYWFLDLIPKDGPAGGTFYQLHFLRAHSFAQIDLARDSMKMSFLDAAWLQKQIDAKNAEVSFQKAEGTLLLTGPSEEVRDLGYRASHENGFSNAIDLDRQEDQP